MFGFGYRKRALAAEALVDKLRREKAARYERLWLQSVKPGPVHDTPTATAPAPSFSSGGGGDYGGGGASSSWGDSSSSCSSSSSDSSSYSSSDSSSSSCSSSFSSSD